MKKVLILLIGALVWVQCGASSGGSDAADSDEPTPTSSDDATTADAASGALSDSLGSSLGGGGGPANLVKRQSEDPTHNYDCTVSSDQTGQTCACPGGGSVTYSYNEQFVILATGGSFDQSMTVTFNDCAVPSCGDDQTINGQVTGTVSGTISDDGFMATAVMATAGECDGLSVGDTELGFSFTMTLDGSSESVSGEMAIAPECVVIEFDSWDDLMGDLDPDGACEE